MRLALLTNIVPPYRVPVFNALATSPDCELTVLTFARTEANRNWSGHDEGFRFERRVLPGLHLRGRRPDRVVHLNAGLGLQLARLRPEVLVVGGFDQPALLEAMAIAHPMGIRTVLWSGAHGLASAGSRLMRPVKRWAVQRADAFVAYGTSAAEHLVELGADPSLIITSRNAVDVAAFRREPHQADAAKIREGLHAAGRVIVLFVGQLIARKGVDSLIEAVGKVSNAHLVLVGSGPDRAGLEALADRCCPGRATFLGSVPYARLPAHYAAADVFVMPSRAEVWGLVLNEAMAAGLPVVSGRRAGATRDLVVAGQTGFSIDPDEIEEFAGCLTRLVEDPVLRNRAGKAAARLIAEVTPQKYADDILDASRIAMRSRR